MIYQKNKNNQKMKKTFLFFASCLAVFLIAGCAKETVADDPGSKEEATKGYVTFTSSPITRTSTSVVDGNSKTIWNAGDEITVTYNGNDYVYVAQESGETTSFTPKTETDAIPVAADHTYTLTAKYGNGLTDYNTQTVTGGVNTFQQPLSASLEAYYSESDEIQLAFSQEASLFDLTFAAEDLTINSLHIEGLQESAIEVTFTDGLDLSSGDASVQVVCGAISTDPSVGVFLRATLSDESQIGRVIWLGSGMTKNYPVGSHVRQPLSVWKKSGTAAAGISSAKELKEFQILTSKRCPTTRFTVDGTPDGKVELLADVDISWFNSWSPIGPNGNQDPASGLVKGGYLRNEFDGKGHTVSGLTISRSHNSFYNYGLFGVAAADIHDLTVEGSILVKSGSAQNLNLCVGGIVSTLCPGYSIQRCTSKVSINVQYLGTAALDANDVLTATDATAHKWHRVGGVVGRCSGNVVDCVFGPDDCAYVKFTNTTSAPSVVVNAHYGGVIGHVCEYGANNVTITGCSNEGTVQCDGKMSGHVLRVNSDTNPANGAVHAVFHGMSLGGVVGTLGHMVSEEMTAQSGAVTMSDCHNHSYANQNKAAGGNFGGVVGRTGCDANITITECSNDGTIRGSKTSSESSATTNTTNFLTFGGVIGCCYSTSGEISHLTNKGKVYINNANCAGQLGGVIGVIGTFSGGVTFNDLRNEGEVHTTKTNADQQLNLGGIVGRLWMYRGATFVTLNNVVNTGAVHNASGGKNASVGGLVGMSPGSFNIVGGINKGEITAWTSNGSTNYCKVGGLVGELWEQDASFTSCKQYGNVLFNNTNSRHGFVIGYLDTNTGAVTATGCYAGGKFGLQGGTQTTITAENFSTVLPNESTSISASTESIPMVCKNSNSTYLGTPWEWSYHDVE